MRDRSLLGLIGKTILLTTALAASVFYSGCATGPNAVRIAQNYHNQFLFNKQTGKDKTVKNSLEEEVKKEFKKLYESKEVSSKDFGKAVNIIKSDVGNETNFILQKYTKKHNDMMAYVRQARDLDISIAKTDIEKMGIFAKKFDKFIGAEAVIPGEQFKDDIGQVAFSLFNLCLDLERKEKDPGRKKMYHNKRIKTFGWIKENNPDLLEDYREPVFIKQDETGSTETKDPLKSDEPIKIDTVVMQEDDFKSTPFNFKLEASGYFGGEKTTTTSGGEAFLGSNILDCKAIYNYDTWTSLSGDDVNESHNATCAQLKPLGIAKVSELFGASIPDYISNALEFSFTFDFKKRNERKFTEETIIDANIVSRTDTQVNTIVEETYRSGSAKFKGFGFSLSVTPFSQTITSNTHVDTATYVTNLNTADANYETALESDTGLRVTTKGMQAEVKYAFDKKFDLDGKVEYFEGDVGFLLDRMEIYQRNNGVREILKNTLVGLTTQGKIGNYFGFNSTVLQEYFDGVGKNNDGLKDCRAFFSLYAKTSAYEMKDIDGNVINTWGAVAWAAAWYTQNRFPGAGGGIVVGTGKMNTDYIGNMLSTFGKNVLDINREQGQTIGEAEINRVYRNLPLQINKGFSVHLGAYGFMTKNENNEDVMGVMANGGFSAGPVALTVSYLDNRILKKMGVYVHAKFGRINIFAGFNHEEDIFKKDESNSGELGFIASFGQIESENK